MGAIWMQDIKANGKHCLYCKTGFGGLAWQWRCRKQSVAVKGVFSTRVPKPRLHYKLFWSPLLWKLLHVDFTGIETMTELDATTTFSECFGLLWPLHDTLMAYLSPDQTAKTVAKFLWQGCIWIFRAQAKLLSDRGANFESNSISELCKAHGDLESENFAITPPD